jgi:hypothetical protein
VSRLLIQVLRVARDFDEFGGISAELVAWELGIPTDAIEPAWDTATCEGLLSPASRDKVYGEEMWRITPAGQIRLDVGEAASALPGANAVDLQPPATR